MIPDSRFRRFDPRRLRPAIGTDGAELFGTPEAFPGYAAEASRDDPVGGDVDEALEQMASNGCRVCPLCGAIVARDESGGS